MKEKHKLSVRLLSTVTALALITCILPGAGALLGSDGTAATMEDIICSADAGRDVQFHESHFTAAIPKDLKLEGIVITELPPAADGVLKYGDRDIMAGEAVMTSGLGGLKFIPDTAGELLTSFRFLPVFESGSGESSITVSINLSNKPNSPPVAEQLELSTYRNISINGVFKGVDPDGDKITYKLVKKPARGEVIISDDNDSSFIYKPYQNKTGTDTFTYVAVDSRGGTSAEAKVSIKIEKASTKLTYADMDGNPSYYAAIKIAEEGIFTGEKLGDSYFFQPDKPVTRGEFVAMAVTCMNLDSAPVSRTGFADDDATPTWAMPYISSALKAGIIKGIDNEEGQKVFRSDSPLSRGEAAVMLDNALDVADIGVYTMFADEEAIPTWALQPVVNLESVGVMSQYNDGSIRVESQMTRAEAAEMLYGAIKVLDTRKTKTGLLGWVW